MGAGLAAMRCRGRRRQPDAVAARAAAVRRRMRLAAAARSTRGRGAAGVAGAASGGVRGIERGAAGLRWRRLTAHAASDPAGAASGGHRRRAGVVDRGAAPCAAAGPQLRTSTASRGTEPLARRTRAPRRAGCRRRVRRASAAPIASAWRRELFVDRSTNADRDDTAAHRAPRANSAARNLGGIDAKYGLTLRTGNVHFASVADVTLRDSDPAISGGVGASVRRSIEYTDPGNVLA